MNELTLNMEIENIPSSYFVDPNNIPIVYQSDDALCFEYVTTIDGKKQHSFIQLRKSLLRDILNGTLK
jgi:hypothetical protein